MSRVLDLFGSLLAILALAPVLLLTTAWILAASPGPVFFRQERVGRGGRPFQVLKFRTMRPNSAAQGSGSVTVRDDPRLFRGARFLRKYKVDELPQLFHVLAGTMALVGPRPTVFEDFEKMSEEQRERFAVRPGITGLAQIRGGTALYWPERIALDREYIARRSVVLDLRILCETAWQVVSGKADTHPPGDDEWGPTRSELAEPRRASS